MYFSLYWCCTVCCFFNSYRSCAAYASGGVGRAIDPIWYFAPLFVPAIDDVDTRSVIGSMYSLRRPQLTCNDKYTGRGGWRERRERLIPEKYVLHTQHQPLNFEEEEKLPATLRKVALTVYSLLSTSLLLRAAPAILTNMKTHPSEWPLLVWRALHEVNHGGRSKS